jgi:hypothetical protein
MKKLFLFFCLVFHYPILFLFAQTDNSPSEDSIFVICSIDFNITGHTRPEVLNHNGEFKTGEEIHGIANLEKYIRNKTRFLHSQRIFKDTSTIEYTIGERRDDNVYPVALRIVVEDTWNIIAIPYPKYSSNSGLELVFKARDYNFLGLMNPLKIDFGYLNDENQNKVIAFELDSDIPFRAFGLKWNLNFDHFFNYRFASEAPFYYKNITGLSMGIPVKRTTIIFGFDESFILGEKNEDKYILQGYDDFQNGFYMSSRPFILWKIPIGLEIGNYGELTYTPEIAAVFNHELPNWPLQDIRLGPSMELKHRLGFTGISWIGNYRQGFDAAVENLCTYNFHRSGTGREALFVDYTVLGTAHFIITDFLGFSSRLQFRQWLYRDPDYYDLAGDVLRGILDKTVQTDYMLSLNLDFPFQILRFFPSKWFNTSLLRVFDFDIHFSPIMDLALYHPSLSSNQLDSDKRLPENGKISLSNLNILVSGGFEILLFPKFMRSFYLRASFAWNVIEQINTRNGNIREVFIGIGHYY